MCAPSIEMGQATESMQSILDAYGKSMPQLSKIYGQAMPDVERGRWNAFEQFAPLYSQLQTDIALDQMPQLSDLGKQMTKASVEGDLAGIEPGKELGQGIRDIGEIMESEFYKIAGPTADKTAQLVGGLDPNALSPSERREIEQALARQGTMTGGITAPSMSNAVGSAMQFGSGMQNKQARISQLLNQAASTASGVRSGYDPTQVTLRRPGMTAAWGQFRGADPAIGQAGQSAASQGLGLAGQMQGQYNQAIGQFQSNPLYTLSQNTMASMGSSMGSFMGNPAGSIMG